MSIHVAITRRVRPGHEEEFKQGLREFFQASFEHGSVLGASLITPLAGEDPLEYGIIRTFTNEKQRDEFYASPMFAEWDRHAAQLTEGETGFRELQGLEAFFRSPHGNPPPKWKMAIATAIGVYPTSLFREKPSDA